MFFPWDFLVGHETPSERWGVNRALRRSSMNGQASKHSASSQSINNFTLTNELVEHRDSVTRSDSPPNLLTSQALLAGQATPALSEDAPNGSEYALRPISDVRPPANPYCGGGMPNHRGFSGVDLDETMAFLHIGRTPTSFIPGVGQVYHAPEFDGRPLHMVQHAGENLCGYYSIVAALDSLEHPLIDRESFLDDCAAARRAQYAEMQIAPGTHDERTSFVCAYDVVGFLERHFRRNNLAAGATEIYDPTNVFFLHRQNTANINHPNPPAAWLSRHYNQVREAQALLLMSDAHWTAFVRKAPGIWTHIDSFHARSQARDYKFDSALDAVMAYAGVLKVRNRYEKAESIETMVAISEI